MQKRTAFLLGIALVICILAFGVSYERNQLILSVLDGLQNVGSCSSCMVGSCACIPGLHTRSDSHPQALLMPLKALANMGDDALSEALIDICTGLNVCFGSLNGSTFAMKADTSDLVISDPRRKCLYRRYQLSRSHHCWHASRDENFRTVLISPLRQSVWIMRNTTSPSFCIPYAQADSQHHRAYQQRP